jgi:hypothetical protein
VLGSTTLIEETPLMLAEQTATTVLQLHSFNPAKTIELVVSLRLLDDDSGADVTTSLSYEPKLFKENWELQLLLHQQLFNAIHDGLSIADGAIPSGGIYAEIQQVRVEPPINADMSREDVAKFAHLLNRLVMGMVAGLRAALITHEKRS